MHNIDYNTLRSRAVTDIISRKPHFLQRYGILIESMLIVSMIVFCSIFKFPEAIHCNVRIDIDTSNNNIVASSLIDRSDALKIRKGQDVYIEVELPEVEPFVLNGKINRIRPADASSSKFVVLIDLNPESISDAYKYTREYDSFSCSGGILIREDTLFKRFFSIKRHKL